MALPAETMAVMEPREVDSALEASLPPSVRSGLREIVREWTGSHGYDFEFIRFDFDGAPEADVHQALATLEAVNAPCPLPIAEKAIATLRVRTKARAEDAADMKLMLAVFSQDIADYPPDVVVDTCKAWARMEKWFPSWSELKGLLDRRVKRRRRMLDALRRQEREGKNAEPEITPAEILGFGKGDSQWA